MKNTVYGEAVIESWFHLVRSINIWAQTTTILKAVYHSIIRG